MRSFVDFVKSMLTDSEDNKLTKSALSSFLLSLRVSEADALTEEDVQLWVINMVLKGFKRTTRTRYLARLKRIYDQWTIDDSYNPFSGVNDTIEDDVIKCIRCAESNLELLHSVLAKSSVHIPGEPLNAFLFLLYDIDATLPDIINLKFDELTQHIPQIEDIIEAQRHSKQLKYVFGLNRAAKRTPQLTRELLSAMKATLCIAGMKFKNEFSRDTITALWIAAALRCKIPISEIRSMLKSIPDDFSFLSLVRHYELTEERKTEILKRVADSINDNTRQWFVMRMRSGKTPDDVKAAIKDKASKIYTGMTFYYPTHVVHRERKAKTIREEVPYIPGILFIKTRQDLIRPMLNKIGDLGWCYKHTNTPRSPYSIVPGKEMEKFQRHIGKFSDDIRIELLTHRKGEFEVNEVVKINGGMMAGKIGVITAVHNQDGTTTYSLQLSSDSVCRWTLTDVEETLVEPLA